MSALPPGSGTFNSHPNVHFDTTTKKWTFESPETGAEFEFDERARIWVPVVRPPFLAPSRHFPDSLSGRDKPPNGRASPWKIICLQLGSRLTTSVSPDLSDVTLTVRAADGRDGPSSASGVLSCWRGRDCEFC